MLPTNILKSVPTHAGSRFTWSGKVGTIEMSDFAGNRFAARVWNDSQDIGFIVRSHVTGDSRLFLLEGTRNDDEGEMVAMVFRSYPDRSVEVHILND